MMRSGGRSDTIEDLESEMDYFRKVVKRVTEDYAVDTERIYCTGHSNGSITTNAVAELLDDIFAAAVPVGAPAKQYETYEEMPLKERRMPFMDIDIYRLTAVVLIIWGAVTAYELVSVRLGKKRERIGA